jgi:hypothetical protein
MSQDGELVVLKPTDESGGYLELLRAITKISARRAELLERLITEAKANGARVVIFITPYSPAKLASIRADQIAWSHHLQAVAYLLSLWSRYGIHVTDYTDEASFGGTPDEWHDGVHVSGNNTVRLARSVIRDGL